MTWTLAGIVLLLWLPLAAILLLLYLYLRLCQKYINQILRIFTEKPIFVIPRGERPEHSEDVQLTTPDGLRLAATYLPATNGPPKGVILFGLEFGSNRWSAGPYCIRLRAAGYDVFTYEPRNQGDSDKDASYESLQWVTDRDVTDCKTAVEYLKRRAGAQAAAGIGLYGISKGGSAGLAVAADDPFIRCCLTDGAFATYSTVLPYMRYWYSIYDKNYALHGLIHPQFYGAIGNTALWRSEQQLKVHYVSLEKAVAKLSPRPWLMIHGDKDSYIRPSMAKALYDCAKEPKDFWLVPGARHNQAIEVAGEEYTRRVVEFFDEFLK